LRKTGAIDDVHRTISVSRDAEKDAEGKRIIEDLVALKYELQHDRKLSYGKLPYELFTLDPAERNQ